MNGTQSGMGWGARLFVALVLMLVGAAAAIWSLGHYQPAARFLGIAPAAPPMTAPIIAPRAVEPVWFPITPPTAAPVVAPMTAPFCFWLIPAQAVSPNVPATMSAAIARVCLVVPIAPSS